MQKAHFIAQFHFSTKQKQFNRHAEDSKLFSRNFQTLITAVVATQQITTTYFINETESSKILRYKQDGLQAESMRQLALLTGTGIGIGTGTGTGTRTGTGTGTTDWNSL
jgi:hypothetical protein